MVETVASTLALEVCDPRAALLNLMSMCCVCKQWRDVASEAFEGFELILDTSDSVEVDKPLVKRFNTQSVEKRSEFFMGVVRLLRGVTVGLPFTVHMKWFLTFIGVLYSQLLQKIHVCFFGG